ncbi:hypothetical protein AX15_001110 [Amanita polypyramis BW_CC]|nr:hypothetical protein AX15_001110 [Amanita polypyramis BW_CC]
MPLTIDELRWLQFCRTMDSTPVSSRSTSPLPILRNSQAGLPRTYDTLTLTSQNHKWSKGADTPVHPYRAMHPVSAVSASVPIVGNGFEVQDSSSRSCLQLAPSSPSRIIQGPAAMSSSCQEWIYRRPNKSPRHYQRPSQTAMSIPSRTHSRHPRDQHEQSSLPQTNNLASRNESIANPFWSTILHPRSHSERSIRSLKAKPSRPQLVISRPFTPLPTISSSPVETSFTPATTKQLHLRSPSVTSTDSTASTSSMSRLGTPTIPSFSYNTRRRQHKKENYGIFSGSFDGQHTRHLDYPLLSSSCPPGKSILTRSSSMLTKGSHNIPAPGACSPSKSVKFVEIPTVHYASAGYWDCKGMDEIRRVHDVDMGIDVEGMDLGHDSCIDGLEEKVAELHRRPETAHEAQCSTSTPERATALKRLMNLKQERRNNGRTLTPTRRPTISGPYALGTIHGTPSDNSYSPTLLPAAPYASSPQQTQFHLPSATTNSPESNRLRGAPSLESVKSVRSAAARSIRSVGSMKTTATVRGFRAWIEKSFGPNVKVIFGAG